MRNEHYVCSATVGSLTQAMKAQGALSSAAIPSEIIKTEKGGSRRGCVYSIGFSCAQENNVRTVLGASKIQASGWNRGK